MSNRLLLERIKETIELIEQVYVRYSDIPYNTLGKSVEGLAMVQLLTIVHTCARSLDDELLRNDLRPFIGDSIKSVCKLALYGEDYSGWGLVHTCIEEVTSEKTKRLVQEMLDAVN